MSVTRIAIGAHRWLGVALCLVFLLWFLSGIGMMYWDFPGVTAEDRLARASALDPSSIRVAPAEAFAELGSSGPPAEARLGTFDGRPVYRFLIAGRTRLVYADAPGPPIDVSRESALRVAAAWAGRPAAEARVESIDAADQWIVEGTYRPLMPMWKCSWPGGEQAYVSRTTGEVEQYTTRASRIEAYLGPIPHWLYFAPLRKHASVWRRVVIGLSAMGTLGATLGLAIGVSLYSPKGRYRVGGGSTSIPFRGPKRWHMALGLIFGLGAVTWAFSGLLSMDPGGATPALLGPPRLAAFATQPPAGALLRLPRSDVTELELASFSGEPLYLAHLAGGRTVIVSTDGHVSDEFDRRRMVEIAGRWPGGPGVSQVRVLDRYDAYYLDRRRRRPLPVLAIAMADAARTRYYVDPKTARVVGTYSSRDWVARWLYHGLHSLEFPWLYARRPLWDIVVITFMLGGAALSTTSIALAWRVVGGRLTPAAARANLLR